MSDEVTNTTTTNTTPTSYDLISINNVDIPDVRLGKGAVSVQRNPKYERYDCEEGNVVVDPYSTDKIKGEVSFNGLLQSDLQTIASAVALVSQMTIYNPLSGTTRTFMALIEENPADKIIHDANANAWSYGFTFEEIDYVTTPT